MLRKEKIFSTKGAVYTSIGCQPNVSKSFRNKAPKARHKSGDVSHVALSELMFIRHSIFIGLSPYVDEYRTLGASVNNIFNPSHQSKQALNFINHK